MNKKQILLLLGCLTLTHMALAAQKIQANPDEVVQVVASMSDANIISISGGSIESVWGTEDKVTLEANVDTGQAFFRPVSSEAFTLFVQSAAGHTYTLSVVPRVDIIGQMILLDEFSNNASNHIERSLNIVTYKSEIKRLLKLIEQSPGIKKLRGFKLKPANKTIPLWSETRILHAMSWIQGSMIIDKYLVTNVTDEKLVIEEREFRGLASLIRAIAIRKHQLDPAETTVLYTFKGRS
jgi:hypothetical protein